MSLRQYFTTNTWWGKLIGAFLGYLIAGSTGALFGILIGNFFDRGLAEHFARPHWHYHAERRQAVQKIFFEATFSVMGRMAKVDGFISEREIQMANTLMDEMGLSSEQRANARHFFQEGKQPNFNLENILTSLKKASHDNPELLKLFIDIQYRAAQIDSLSAKKIELLNIVLNHLGFASLNQQYRFYEDFSYQPHQQQSRSQSRQQSYSSSNKQQSYQSSSSPLAHAFAMLGINPSATQQEVKRAYRRLVSRNHPDKLIAQGLPEEMIKVANDKTQKIRKAYEQICTSKGWNH